MPKGKPYIERRYVELREGTESSPSGFGIYTGWTATVDGPASTKETVRMSRSSMSAGEALLLLTEALEEQGYALR